MIMHLSAYQSEINKLLSIYQLSLVIDHTDKMIQELGMQDTKMEVNM